MHQFFSQHCKKRKRWRHQVFNICWQMVSCWFVLLILYLLNLDICEKAKCIVFIGLFWWRDTFNLYILYTNASKGIYIRDLQQENINKWLRPGSRLLFGIFVINLHISTSNQIGWLTAIVKNVRNNKMITNKMIQIPFW